MSGKSHAARNTAPLDRLGQDRSAEARAGVTAAGSAGLWSSGVSAARRTGNARHAFGDLQVQAGSRLAVGKPDDAYEIEAERAADRAVVASLPGGDHSPTVPIRQGGGILSPARPGLVQARARSRAGGEATPDLPQKIENAAVEGHPLPAAQRSLFEQRLGHDFSAVRIHDGPAAAAAADSAGAQAFAHGQKIYFGEGQYRPDSGPGQWLLAHELAHTVQQRPNVIARRALAMGGEDPSAATATDAGQAADPHVDDTVDALTDVTSGSSALGGQIAKERLQDLDTPARLAALARLQSQVPPADKQKVAARLDDAFAESTTPSPQDAQGSASGAGARQESSVARAAAAGTGDHDEAAAHRRKEGEGKRGVELRSPTTTAPVPTQNVAEGTEAASAPAPSHARASAAAATKMQQAVQSVTEETAVQGEPALDASQAAGAAGPSAKADKPAPTAGAQAAANEAVATMAAQLSQLANVRSVPVRFQMDAEGPPSDPREALRRQDSDGLAAAFVEGAAKQVEAVIAAATKIPAQALASLADARSAVAADTAGQIAAIHDGAEAARKKVSAQSTRARAIVDGLRVQADSATGASAKSTRDRAKTAYDDACKGVDEKADKQKTAIDEDFRAAAKPLAAVGREAGHQVWLVAEARREAYHHQKTGESTILDGSYHDDQCDARAEAAEQVGEEYGKSFRASAKEQADKLPAGKPEVIAKVAEVAKKLDDGLGDQLKQINEGADAFEKGAKAQSRQAGAKIKSSIAASAAQSTSAIDQMEEEQTQQLAAQGEKQQNSLDQAAESALAAVASGVARACGQLVESIGIFIASAASTPSPPREELAPALDQAGGQAADGVAAMRGQLETVGPALAANLSAGAQAATEGLAAAAAAVRQSLDQTADSFAQSAADMTQQAASGFRSLTKANEKTAVNIAKTAEDGFKAALEAAAGSFKLFSEKVQETFQAGRQQLFDSLWSKETQAKLDQDISTYADEAASKVQPRWKKVLKWAITIIVVIAVIAITIASAGSLGPVGIVLLGAALGAAAGAVQTIANNLIDGKKWSDGVAKAMIVGAISGAVGGAGGVVLKGVGSIGVKIALEAGINVIGGVTGEAVGSVAVGEAINWEGAVVGALIGAGIGAGLGIAGALKSKIRFGSFGGEAPSVPRPRPAVESPAPAGKLRSFFEQTKILAPRPGAPMPEVNVGAAASGEPATPARAPEPAPTPAATPEPTALPPRRAIGFGDREPIAPTPEPAPDAPRRAIGFGNREPIAPTPEPAPNAPRRAIGFGDREPIAPTPEPAPNAPRRAIGFGDREPIAPKAVPGGEPSAVLTELPRGAPLEVGAPSRPGANLNEPSPPGAGGAGGHEPIRAGGRSSLEVQASGKAGGGRGAGGEPQVLEPPKVKARPAESTPAKRPAQAESTQARSEGVEEAGVGGEGKKSAATNEAAEPETGAEKEVRELGSDPRRPAKGSSYYDYEGGERGSFFQFVKKLKGHLKAMGKTGEVEFNDKLLRQKTEDFLVTKPSLKDKWWGMQEKLRAQMDSYSQSNPNYNKSDYYKGLERFKQELEKFGKGQLGRKRPDLVEVFLDKGRVEVTDITQKFGQEFHEFKTRVYTEFLNDLFPELEAKGREYGSATAQKALRVGK